MRLARLATVAALLALSPLAACGGGDDGDDEPEPPPPRPVETVHKLPKLERGWKPHLNRSAGVAAGRPPGWAANSRGPTTIMRSPDRLIAITVTIDRTDESLEIPVEQFALRTTRAIPGFEGELEPSEPRPFKGRYRGVEVTSVGVSAKNGVRQRVRVIVLRRPRLATIVAVIAANTKLKRKGDARDATKVVRTISTRPIGAVPPR